MTPVTDWLIFAATFPAVPAITFAYVLWAGWSENDMALQDDLAALVAALKAKNWLLAAVLFAKVASDLVPVFAQAKPQKLRADCCPCPDLDCCVKELEQLLQTVASWGIDEAERLWAVLQQAIAHLRAQLGF